MENTEQNKVWQDLILNPGNNDQTDEQWGLDDRLLDTMIEQGVIPRDILSSEVELTMSQASLPGNVRHIVEEKTGLKASSLDSYIKVPLWIPWIARRKTRGWQEAQAAMELMHKLDLVPWAEPICEFTAQDIRGIDLLFNFNWPNSQSREENNLLEVALEATPEDGREVLRARTRRVYPAPSWVASCKRTYVPKQFLDMAKYGLWSPENDPGQVNDTVINLPNKNMFDLAVEHGANPRAVRDSINNLTEVLIPEKIIYIEEMDKKLDEEHGRPTKSYPMDKIINLIAVGSSAIDSETLERQLEKGKTTHRNGVGLGYTMLAVANCSRQTASSILGNIEKKLDSCPQWCELKNKEAAGLEGSGITEGECFALARIICAEPGVIEHHKKIDADRFAMVLDQLIEQTKINIDWGSLAAGLQQSRLWLDYALSPNADPNSKARAKLLEVIGGDTQFDVLVGKQRKDMPLCSSTFDNTELAMSLLLCLGSTHASSDGQDRQGADKWAAKAMEYWSVIVLTSALNDDRFSKDEWNDEDTGYNIAQTVQMLDPAQWAKELTDCPTFQKRFAQFIDFLERPLNMKNMGYRWESYEDINGATPKVSPLDYMTKFMAKMMDGAENLSAHHHEALTLIKKTYLTAKHGMAVDGDGVAKPKMKM